MASLRKNKAGKWEAQIARKGIRKSATFETKAEASEWATQIEAEILGGKKATADKSFGDLLERYKNEVTPTKGGRYTEEKLIERLLKDEIASIKLKDLQPFHFAEWRNWRLKEVSGSTVTRAMAVMSAAISISIKEWGWVSVNPLRDVVRPRSGPARDRRIAVDEVDRIICASGYRYDSKPETITARTGAAFLFAIETGMRDGELAALTMDRVNLETRVAHVRAEDSKGRMKRDVPLSQEAVRIIKQMGASGSVFGLTSVQITKAFVRIKTACMIDDLTFHDTRHEAITRLSTKLDTLALARTVGHRNLNQLTAYYNLGAADIAAKL